MHHNSQTVLNDHLVVDDVVLVLVLLVDLVASPAVLSSGSSLVAGLRPASWVSWISAR